MNEGDKKDKKGIRIFGFTWKFWLGLSLFIAYVIGVQIEKNSPSTEANRRQLYQNAVQNMYQDAYDSCSSTDTDSEKDCREEAERAAELTRDHLGPPLGQ